MSADAPSFRDELEALERIVRTLEEPDVDLDRAIELFQEGVARLQSAREVLAKTELTIQQIVRTQDAEADDDLDD